jgi:phage tail-like protein
MGMLEDDFFARFAAIFQEVAATIIDDVDNLDNVIDYTVAPPAIVRWLGTWLGIADIDSSLPDELQRKIVREWGQILAWRGTRRGLVAYLELLSGGPAVVSDTGGIFVEGGAPRGAPTVHIEVDSTGWVADPDDFVTMVLRELPAQVLLELTVGGQRLWPPDEPPTEPPTGSPATPTYHPPSTPQEPNGPVDEENPWPAAIGDEWSAPGQPVPVVPRVLESP